MTDDWCCVSKTAASKTRSSPAMCPTVRSKCLRIWYFFMIRSPTLSSLLRNRKTSFTLICCGNLLKSFRGYAQRGGQVFVSTHSPEFLNGVKLGEVFCLVKKDGFSNVVRPDNNETLRNLVNGGETPGYLWRQGLFEEMMG